jgi:hypothetical protein
MDDAQQVDEFTPAILCGLWQSKHGRGKQSQMEFVQAALTQFEGISPAELRGIWDRTTATSRQPD